MKLGIKSYKAEALVEGNRIVKFGAADHQVIKGAAVADALLGVSENLDTPINEMCDVVLVGIAEVRAGGNIARGDWLTSDANGKAVAAAPAAGTNNNVIGRALAAAALDDIVQVLLAQNRIQG